MRPDRVDHMPNENALLPPTIHLGYLPDDQVIRCLNRARESIHFVGPGPSSAAACVLAGRWQDRHPQTWSFGRCENDGDPIQRMTYFRVDTRLTPSRVWKGEF